MAGTKPKEIALAGNPNCGKTTIFNGLTGLNRTTANYPGVTVEKKSGQMRLRHRREIVDVLDLPGTYSLLPRSLDEEIVHNVLIGVQEGVSAPDLAVVILDTNNFERNLYLALQVMETGVPVILVFNMWDLARDSGVSIDLKKMEELSGAVCVKTVGGQKEGIRELRSAIEKVLGQRRPQTAEPRLRLIFPEDIEVEISKVARFIEDHAGLSRASARGEALRIITDEHFRSPVYREDGRETGLHELVMSVRKVLEQKDIDWSSLEAEWRYRQIEELSRRVVQQKAMLQKSMTEKIDGILTHRIWGFVIFLGFMGVLFQSVFSWAQIPMSWISNAVDWLSHEVSRLLPHGNLESLMVDGIIAGVGNVLVFLPQIFLLFFFIALAEDSGYMARAAFVLDRVMKKVGLNGKAFLPLLSSFACAVPGIMATRTIEDRNDRLATILVAPLMSCSARLPIYTLMIGAFIPAYPVLGMFDLKGVTLLSMYCLSIVMGLGMASLFRKTFLKGSLTPFIFELPPYRIPNLRSVLLTVWDRGSEFLYRAGSIIFCLSIILWFLASYPKDPSVEQRLGRDTKYAEQTLRGEALQAELEKIHREYDQESIRLSFMGRVGHFIEPVIRPLGFDWKIGVGIMASFAAREVFVSTLAIVYNLGDHEDATSVNLAQALRQEVSPVTGLPVYTPLVAVALMVFFVLACQCMSTIVVVKRETASWRWPIFMVVYMSVLAWVGTFLVYHGGKLLGFN
ncbi:MAG: ferrous iron transport protein B [Candidatus Omnitrophica bacterium]|nr:ferrous iron transport protein B [Candidatus Omnitrophota bacterium]MDD5671772.1 ferrous iron transport protein B [Candidatus Omnitrophota bacterium]